MNTAAAMTPGDRSESFRSFCSFIILSLHHFDIHPMSGDTHSRRSWAAKFGDAFRGVREEIRGQSSFRVHFAVAGAVIVCGLAFRVSLIEWCVLLLCIAGVLTAEMFNTAMEALAKAITDQANRHIAAALDIASAAVLVASVGSAIVGGLVFVNRLGQMAGWW